MQSSPTINIPGRSNGFKNRSRRVQSLTAPRAQSYQDPTILWDRPVIRPTSHHEGILDIKLTTEQGDEWSPRFCILNEGEFSFDEIGPDGRGGSLGTPPQHKSAIDNQVDSNPQTITNSGSIPLEMASCVRTARRYENAFILVLSDKTEHTFKAQDKTSYQEWLFFFHSSILAVADRIRLNRSLRPNTQEDVSFRAWRGDLGGSATFLSPSEQDTLGAISPPRHQDNPFAGEGESVRRMPTRDKSWSSDNHQYTPTPPNMSSSLKTSWIPPPRSPVGRSRSSSMATASSTSLSTGGSLLGFVSSQGVQEEGGNFFGRHSQHTPSSVSPPVMGVMEPFELDSAPQEGGGLVRTSTIHAVTAPSTPSTPTSALSASLRATSRLPTPPSVTTSLTNVLLDDDHSPPLYGSPPRRFNQESREDSLDGSYDSNRNSESHPLSGLLTSSGGTGSRRASLEAGFFDLSLEEADFSNLASSSSLLGQPLSKPSPPTSAPDIPPASPTTTITPNLLNSISPAVTPQRNEEETDHRCVRWHSAVFCARGVRPKNEDTYYISDDAAGGRGFSSESLLEADATIDSLSGKGPRGCKSQDGTTSKAMGGGMEKPKWDKGKESVGFYGVYDGHCGRLASEMLSRELHVDVFSELGSLVDVDPDISSDSNQAREEARAAALSKAFVALDSRFLLEAKKRDLYDGSTAVVALVIEGGRKVVVANLGDSGAVVVRRSEDMDCYSPSNMKEGENEEESDTEEARTTRVTINTVTQTSQDMFKSTVFQSYQSLEVSEKQEKQEWDKALKREGQFEAVCLSEDHKPNRPDEQLRIEAARGWVTIEKELFMGQLQMMDLDDPFIASRAEDVVQWVIISRVCQELAVSRAFGDPDFKGFSPNSHTTPPDGLFFPFPQDHPGSFCEDLVLATPEVKEHTLVEGDDFLVLATDGLWDVLSPQGVCQAIRRFKAKYHLSADTRASEDTEPQEALCLHLAEELVRLALRLGSADNVTVTVIAFDYV